MSQIKITDNEGNEFKFTYDSLGRKIKLEDPDLGTWTYEYDANGNLISQSGGGGNLVTGDGFYRVYNSLNQLSKIYNGSSTSGKLLEEYTYHPIEERVLIKKVYYLNTSLKETVYYVSDEFVRVVNTSGTYDTTYVKHDGQLVAELKPNGNKTFYHPDHLGSTTLITNQKRIQFNIKNYYYPLTATWGIKSDGQTFTNNIDLDTNEVRNITQDITYTTEGDKTVNISVYSGSIRDSQEYKFKIEALEIDRYNRYNFNNTKKIVSFIVTNQWPQNLSVGWNLSDPLISNSTYLNQNKSIIVIIEANYTTKLKKPRTLNNEKINKLIFSSLVKYKLRLYFINKQKQ